jgi:hypothetical protein
VSSVDDAEGSWVVVPSSVGELLDVEHSGQRRGELDDVVDDLLGAADERGPGIADAVLVGTGATLIIVGLALSWPTWLVVSGALSAGLGLVLPTRWLLQRAQRSRNQYRRQRLVGDGLLVRVDAPLLRDLVEQHRLLWELSLGLTDSNAVRVRAVAHSALSETASLLDGSSPVSLAEIDYVTKRLDALTTLACALSDSSTGDGDGERRQAAVSARDEIDQLDELSSLNTAAQLTRQLRSGRGS